MFAGMDPLEFARIEAKAMRNEAITVAVIVAILIFFFIGWLLWVSSLLRP